MLKNRIFVGCLMAFLVAGLTGCPDDETNTNNENNTMTSNNTMSSNNMMTDPDMDTMTTTNNMDGDMGPDMTSGTMVEVIQGAKCTDAEPPERCAADADTFDAYAPSSVLSELRMPTAEDPPCCFDYDGLPGPDNILANLVGLAEDVDINETLAEQVESGSLILVLEHQGLSGESTEFDINFLLADLDGIDTIDEAGGNAVTINPASFEMGTHPEAQLPGAKLEGTTVTTGFGNVRLSIALPFIAFTANLGVSAAKVVAEFDESRSNLTDGTGVALTEGKLGGIIQAQEVLDELNTFSSSCTCYQKDGNAFTDPLIEYSDDLKEIGCVADVDTAGCKGDMATESDEACAAIVDTACGFLSSIGTGLDTNPDHIGEDCIEAEDFNCTGLSVGITFEAAGANITGLSDVDEP